MRQRLDLEGRTVGAPLWSRAASIAFVVAISVSLSCSLRAAEILWKPLAGRGKGPEMSKVFSSLPGLAQDPEGGGAGGVSPCDACLTGRINCGQIVNGALQAGDCMLEDGSLFDVWRFDLTAAQMVEITLSSVSFDTYLFLLAGDCSQIADNDDCNDNTDSCLRGQLAPGTYFLAANSYAAGETGGYTMLLRCSDITFCRDCPMRPVECGGSVIGTLAAGDCRHPAGSSFVDLYQFDLALAMEVRISLRSSEFDTVLAVFDGNCLPIAENDDCTDGDLTLSCLTLNLDAGRYAIVANSFDVGETGRYELRVECGELDLCRDCNVGTIACGATANGALSKDDCVLPDDGSFVDLYSFELPQSGEVAVNLGSEQFDPILLLFNDACEIVDSNDDCDGESRNSCLHSTLAAGSYSLGVRSYDPGQVGSYVLSVSCTRGGSQIPGDCTQDGRLNIADGVCLFGYLFPSGADRLPCGDRTLSHPANNALLNWNGDTRLDLTDGVSLLNYLFNGGSGHALGSACAPIEECPESCRQN